MHMADALITPLVGGTMWVASTGMMAYSSRKLKVEINTDKIPLMGVLGAFAFAAQMINFTIPGTGASGHIGGGMLLAILLGPYAGFLAISAVLMIQALFFADGGLLALGCNMFNLGVFTAFIAYPFIYQPLSHKGKNLQNVGIVLATVIGLQLGSLGVVAQTMLSGQSMLPLREFLLLMQPIHLAIGLVEGVMTVAVIGFVRQHRPELLEVSHRVYRRLIITLGVMTLVLGAGLSLLASGNPDGLEWAVEKAGGSEALFESFASPVAFLPDYQYTSLSGIVGGGITLVMLLAVGFGLNLWKKHKAHEA